MKRLLPRHAAHYALLAPYLAGALLLVVVPAVMAFVLAFYRYDGVMTPAWRGWGNFIDVRFDPLFWIALQNSLFFIVVAVPLRLLAALGLALLYNRPRRGAGLYRALAYLPSVIPDAAYALVWLWIFNPLYGPLNAILYALGLPTPAWLLDYQLAKPALAFMVLFQIGEGFVILLAGLKNIPQELYDAAHVDGASRLQAFRRITLPVLAPWLLMLSIRDVILTFQSTFTPAYLMTGGGPYYATLFLPLLVYEEAFEGLRFGIGAAIMLLMFLLTLGIILLVYWLFEKLGI
jgi:multiple sugar transport system permease protein